MVGNIDKYIRICVKMAGTGVKTAFCHVVNM